LKRIPVFYDSRMTAPSASFSPSASKPAAVMDDWQRHGLPIEQMPVTPVTPEQLALAHAAQHVEDILALRKNDGFGGRSLAVVQSLPWTTGSMLSAARWVLERPFDRPVACSPTSGFHHAGHEHAGGFCTFNGLAVTAIALHQAGLAKRIGILDFDRHEGDGTQDIIDRLGLDYVQHFSAGAHYDSADDANQLLLYTTIHTKEMAGCDIVLYQAGADMHVNDPLGGILTTEQMRQRDRNVFWIAREYRIPLVWNLAGGYQRDAAGTIAPVLQLHRQTMQACVDIYIYEQERLK
jgi:acetoin utilization deacetylase AcuC-like enzyme